VEKAVAGDIIERGDPWLD